MTYLLFVFVGLQLFATAKTDLSARRFPSEDWNQAKLRVLGPEIQNFETQRDTPYAKARPVSQLDLKRVPEWPISVSVQEVFNSNRDLLFLEDPQYPEQVRRISWLYPDDGCYARAAVLWSLLKHQGHYEAARVYVFGDLTASTPNHPSGEVSWWYHTAVLVKFDGQPWVLDPSIDPLNPLSLENWLLAQNPDLEKLSVSVCAPDSFSPSDSCLNPTDSDGKGLSALPDFLRYERYRQIELGRLPEDVLGEFPPWKQSQQYFQSWELNLSL